VPNLLGEKRALPKGNDSSYLRIRAHCAKKQSIPIRKTNKGESASLKGAAKGKGKGELFFLKRQRPRKGTFDCVVETAEGGKKEYNCSERNREERDAAMKGKNSWRIKTGKRESICHVQMKLGKGSPLQKRGGSARKSIKHYLKVQVLDKGLNLFALTISRGGGGGEASSSFSERKEGV